MEPEVCSSPSIIENVQISNVLILYTGGTIGMKSTSRGYAPCQGYIQQELAKLSQFHDPTQPLFTTPISRWGKRVHYEIKEYSPLLDSSNMSLAEWIRIARDIEDNYENYNGFIVLHGTDTMSYTASALSFMLEHLSKPVILTGSQIPFSREMNDAADNLLGALSIAGHFEIPEVCLYFRNKLLRGNRSKKVDASGLDSFASPNYPPLATVGIDIKVNWHNVLPAPVKKFRVHSNLNPNVGALRLFPGITQQIMRNFLQPPLVGLVMETYGAGNVPDGRKDFLEVIAEAANKGVIILNVTQCLTGTVTESYASGYALKELGVTSGADMTSEAALTKLIYLLGKDLPLERVKEKLQYNIRGELTSTQKEPLFTLRKKSFIKSVAHALDQLRLSGEDQEMDQIERVLAPIVMCSAASVGDLQELKNTLAMGKADINAADYDKRTALHLAASEGHVDVVEYLIGQGARVNSKDRWGNTPLLDAINSKQHIVVNILRNRGALLKSEDIGSALCQAGAAGDIEKLDQLIKSGCDVNSKDYDYRTALHLAAAEGNLAAVHFLVDNKADIMQRDRWGNTALQEALKNNHHKVVNYLQSLHFIVD